MRRDQILLSPWQLAEVGEEVGRVGDPAEGAGVHEGVWWFRP